jgi:hypothetical protein
VAGPLVQPQPRGTRAMTAHRIAITDPRLRAAGRALPATSCRRERAGA